MLRYFSSAGYIVNKTRSSPDPSIVNMLMHLRHWRRQHWISNFRHILITLNWLVIFLSLLNSITYVLFF